MQDYRKLTVWGRAHALALRVYHVTAKFPRQGHLGLVSQVRRSATSVAANIVEGCSRGTSGDLLRFLDVAFASAAELEYHWLFACDVGLVPPPHDEAVAADIKRVKRMLAGLKRTVRERAAASKARTDR